MAHLPPNAAIFSPSVARAAASAAKDWAFIDSWLQRKFPGRGPPPFERNADTLRALLALASANEAADEEQALIARLEAETLSQLKAHERSQQSQPDAPSDDTSNPTLSDVRHAILTSLSASLTREGQTALDALASLSLQLNIPLPTPEVLASELISLSIESFTLEQTLSRIEILTNYIAREAAATAKLAAELRPPSPSRHHHDDDNHNDEDELRPDGGSNTAKGVGYHPPADLALQNLAAQRRIKSLLARLPELRDKVASLSRSLNTSVPSSSPTIHQVCQEEEAYLALLQQKKELDAQLREFAGLPPDVEQARQELEGLGEELRRMVVRRDEVFEGLVERETPRKVAGGRR
ncbi:hypothetical protein VTI74DRAFT_8906 [Chaetomium olivicolor]